MAKVDTDFQTVESMMVIGIEIVLKVMAYCMMKIGKLSTKENGKKMNSRVAESCIIMHYRSKNTKNYMN